MKHPLIKIGKANYKNTNGLITFSYRGCNEKDLSAELVGESLSQAFSATPIARAPRPKPVARRVVGDAARITPRSAIRLA
jgi:hypothetical protein